MAKRSRIGPSCTRLMLRILFACCTAVICMIAQIYLLDAQTEPDAGTIPQPVPLAGIAQISSGYRFSCAVTTTGTVKCWGENEDGQLGNGEHRFMLHATMPVDAFGLFGKVISVGAGNNFACALIDSGGVRCWGSNSYGQIGDGTEQDRDTPTSVYGLESPITAIAVGGAHTCALTETGALYCWGQGFYGQLGNGDLASSSVPVLVDDLSNDVIAISAGRAHTCAVRATGQILCWGDNFGWQLGDGTRQPRLRPTAVNALGGKAKQVSAGSYHTCALLDQGNVQCWGINARGELGDGTRIDRPTPSEVVDLNSDIVMVSAGEGHTCAVSTQGIVYCWGANDRGQLGIGSLQNSLVPQVATGVDSATVVGAGVNHTCAVHSDGYASCWGGNFFGQVGDGKGGTNKVYPVDVVGLTKAVSAIAPANGHTCAVYIDNSAACWGDNSSGQLGNGTRLDSAVAVDVVRMDNDVRKLVGGMAHTCALTLSGAAQCWGKGPIGRSETMGKIYTTPQQVSGINEDIVDIGAGNRHNCVLTASRRVKCWGSNEYGQLGDGTLIWAETPVDVVGLTEDVVAISVGGDHSCALLVGGHVKCWGSNLAGELGVYPTLWPDPYYLYSEIPVDIPDLEDSVAAIFTGGSHTCILTISDTEKCWGRYRDGPDPVLPPQEVPELSGEVVKIASGDVHSCALTTEGDLQCWGINYWGQLGNGSRQTANQAEQVLNLNTTITDVGAGQFHTCAVTQAGGVKCWGLPFSGQLGDGTAWRATPTPVMIDPEAKTQHWLFLPLVQ